MIAYETIRSKAESNDVVVPLQKMKVLGRSLYSVSADGNYFLWTNKTEIGITDIEKGKEEKVRSCVSQSSILSRDNRYIYSVETGSHLTKWNVKTETLQWEVRLTKKYGGQDRITVSEDDKYLFVGKDVLDAQTGETLLRIPIDEQVQFSSFSPNGQWLVLGLYNPSCSFPVLIADTSTWKVGPAIKTDKYTQNGYLPHISMDPTCDGNIRDFHFSQDSKWLLTTFDACVRLYRVPSTNNDDLVDKSKPLDEWIDYGRIGYTAQISTGFEPLFVHDSKFINNDKTILIIHDDGIVEERNMMNFLANHDSKNHVVDFPPFSFILGTDPSRISQIYLPRDGRWWAVSDGVYLSIYNSNRDRTQIVTK